MAKPATDLQWQVAAMFSRLGSLTFRFRFLVLAAWIVGAGWSLFFAPSIATEGLSNQSAFLPAGTASAQARAALERAFPGATANSSATLVFARESGLTDADRIYVGETAAWLTSAEAPAVVRDAVTSVATAESDPELASMLRSEDGVLEMTNVNLQVSEAGVGAEGVISALRAHLAETAPDGLDAHVTGSAAISTDYMAAVIKGTDSTTIFTVVLVIVILLLIYRAPLAALVPLITIGAAFLVARGVLGVLAAAGWQLSSLLDTFIVVLVFGVGTDYAIFLISRFREEVSHDNWHHASRTTVRRIGAVITASAATVIVGLGSMAFADFGMIQTMGPALAIAIFVTLVAGLTLSPALLAIFGHYLFWPLHLRTGTNGEPGGVFAHLAAAVSKRPGVVTVVVLVALLIPASAMGQMKTNFDILSELPADSDSRIGFELVADHLGKGKVVQSQGVITTGPDGDILSPASLAALRDISQELVATGGVADVTSLVSPEGDGVVPEGMIPSRQLATMADGFTVDRGSSSADSTSILDGEVSDGLASASEYLALLGNAFPDVAASTDFRTAAKDLAAAQEQVQQIRDAAIVSTQLRDLSRAMTSPTAAAGGGDQGSVNLIGDYLDELAAAYPEARSLPAFTAAQAAVAELERKVSIGAALDASSALSDLASWFADEEPDATLSPESLANTPEAKQRRAEMEATFASLADSLDAMAKTIAARPDDIFLPVGLSGETGADLEAAVSAFVSEDRTATRFYLTTTDDPYSTAAFAAIRTIQDELAAAAPDFGSGAEAYLGGPTAEFADVQAVLAKDFEQVAVVTVVGIFIVLVLLLRAVVAPLYLVATVLLSCATALGLSAWFFQDVLGHAGVSFYLPILVFVLLVALGSDYNIFLMSRVREESEGRPIRDGIRIASGRTGAVITSAGLILAGTFGSMATAPLVVLFQVGVAVAVGVLIDTFVVRSILVPAITTLVGDWAWWPFGARGLGRLSWPVVISLPEPDGATAARFTKRRLAVAIALIALVPMLFAGLLTWSLADPTAGLDRLTAVVVSEDEGATLTAADGTMTRLDLGGDLAEELTAGTDPGSFTWEAVDAADADQARDGLASGRYAALLSIPADFSRTIVAIQAGGGATTSAARLVLTTNDATSYALGEIARSLSSAIAASTSQTVTAAYVDHVLLSVDGAQVALAEAAADADSVAAGTTALADDAAGTAAVADEMAAGLERLADGTAAAGGAVTRLAAGVDGLAAGTDKLASGVGSLASVAKSAATGSAALAGGVDGLADGLGTLSAGTAALPAQTAQLAAGASGVADGAAGTAAGARTLADSLAAMASGTAGLGTQAAELDAGAHALAGGAASLALGAGASASAASELATGADELAAKVAGYTTSVSTLSTSCIALGGSAALCAQLQAIADGGPLLVAGASDLASGVHELATGGSELATNTQALADSASELTAGTAPLAAAAPGLEEGIAAVAAGSSSLASGAADLAAGAASLAGGTATLAGSIPALSRAVSDAATGARSLADGAEDLDAGVGKLATGADAIALGARKTAAGAATLADGTATAASGAARLADGMSEVVAGANLVAAETDGLASDATGIASDADAVSAELGQGAASIPTWSEAERQAVAGAVAEPVAVEDVRLHAVAGAGAGLAPYFMAIGVWIGALAAYLALPAVARRSRWSRWWVGPLAGFAFGTAIGAVQVLLMLALLRYGVGIEVVRGPELASMALLGMLAAVAVVQALVVLFGTRGWVVALLLVVLQTASAGAWLPIETAPGFLGALHPLLPMTYTVEAFRTAIAGGTASLVPAALVLVAWTVAGLAITLVAVRLRAGRAAPAPELAPA